ncbi:unnamed protein product [Trichogramma brassicae]|uniref:Uncharacterized protein n=1 Tax=Trichogramma brassicae TaxID=86971 RepID=A0A6H5J1M7_9HYME|nr:unnamed protein product [Trichogramma brassicae]
MGSLLSKTQRSGPIEYRNYPPGCVVCPEGVTPGNPGLFEAVHSKLDELNPNTFDGIRLRINKSLSNHFSVNHTISMRPEPSSLKSFIEDEEDGYKFAASYQGTKRVNRERYPMLYGDITPRGTLRANFVHTLGCRFRVKLSTQVTRNNRYRDLKATAEYRANDATLSATLVDPCLLRREGVLLLQYLQAVTSRIALGAEIAYNRNSNVAGAQQTNIAGALRYSTGFLTISATLGEAGARLCFHQIAGPQLLLGSEFKVNFVKPEAKGTVFYKVVLPRADLVFRAFVDSDWKIGAVFEKQLQPIAESTLLLCAVLDHGKKNMSIGIGLNIG